MSERGEAGRAVLRRILGDAQYERRSQGANPFNRKLRELIDEYCFGEVWTRDGITPAMRSMLVIALLAALGRLGELPLHIRGALNHGCKPEEIEEVLLMVAVYAGIPAGVAGMRAAEEVLRERGLLPAVQPAT